jgi:hypothetical protein
MPASSGNIDQPVSSRTLVPLYLTRRRHIPEGRTYRHSFTLMREPPAAFETSVNFYETARRHAP